MIFSHPFSRYGLALVLVKEGLRSVDDITPKILSKYLESGLSHFRMKTNGEPEKDDFLDFYYIDMQTILSNNIKGNPNKGVYLCPNIITNDLKASNAWSATIGLKTKLDIDPNIFEKKETITMGINPIAGELNNGRKTKTNSSGLLVEVACSAIANTTDIKPYLAYREEGGKYVPTAIIPDLGLDEMKIFIQFYELMLNTSINQRKLLRKKVFRKQGEKPKYTRPPIFNGNFPYAPNSSSFGIIGLLGSIGRWAMEANKIEEGQKVLESLKDKPLYLIQYGNAKSITVNHYVIDLAKENKLSEIVFAIQRTEIYYSDEKNRKAKDSKNQLFDLLSSRYLQQFDKPSFKDFLSIRAEYSNTLIELFNHFFMKQMNISREVVQSVRSLGLWLNLIAYKVAQREAEAKNKADADEIRKVKAKVLIELESSVFGARKPSEVLNVIVRAGRLSGSDAPAESDVFQEALLTGEIDINDAKSMLMAYARTRNKYEPYTKLEGESEVIEEDNTEIEEVNPEIDPTH
ncbi:MAG: hypothetical protein H3C64_02120 [Candidatus Kuenenia stuttgartiensis]|nr:hypothetical protein [Candidatus Kuenenia stuttgartiensis]MCW5914614.1 hypothetical protein [Chitinophagaceae bacterium]MCZ2395279.1 hypothetical protein [Chitinophagales bacterium]